MKALVWGLVVLLIVIHQDVWFWSDDTLLFGFMPVGLFYHACISLGAGFTWFLATQFAWPEEMIEEIKHETEGDPVDPKIAEGHV